MKRDQFNIIYHQKKMKNKQDSFWYDGNIATLRYKGREVTIVASGDIRIMNRDGELVHDGYKTRGLGFPEYKNGEPQNDKDLSLLETYGYNWGNNSWFEIFCVTGVVNNRKQEDCVMGDVAYTYDGAIALAKHYLRDNEFWEEIKKWKK